MEPKEIRHPVQGLIGYLHEVEPTEPKSILVFQLPRPTEQISVSYMKNAKDMLSKSLPDDRNILVIGADVNIYEIAEAESIILKLKGLV